MRIAVAGGTGLLGRKIVAEAERRGHETTVLSRARGVDVATGTGVAAALDGADVLVDALSVDTLQPDTAVDFFERTTRALLDAAAAARVSHHLAVSIVGVDRAPHGYYAGKAAQERLVAASEVPWTIQRATQFHEFAQQMYARAKIGPIHIAPRMRTQPVAADEVAARVVEVAEGGPVGRARDLAGPREESLADMVQRYARRIGTRLPVPAVSLPGAFGRAQRGGLLLPDADADRGVTTFDEWLAAR